MKFLVANAQAGMSAGSRSVAMFQTSFGVFSTRFAFVRSVDGKFAVSSTAKDMLNKQVMAALVALGSGWLNERRGRKRLLGRDAAEYDRHARVNASR